MSIQNRISVTLSPRMKKALELAAGLDGSTTATYAAQLLAAAIKRDIQDDPILFEKWAEVEREAMTNSSWDNVAIPVTVEPEDLQIPQSTQRGWFLAGDNPDSYGVGADKTVTYNEAPSGFIRSNRENIKGFGTLMQQVDITACIGKKLELTAVIRSKDVKQWAGLWARLDDESTKVLWFDNMQDRPIKGTTDWKRVKITFEVPNGSSTLNFGVLLVGTGTVWVNSLKLHELDGGKKKAVTGLDLTLTF